MSSSLNESGQDKIYDKFVVDANMTSLGEGKTVPNEMRVSPGQAKYAIRGGSDSIYYDGSRCTEDDTEALAETEKKPLLYPETGR